MARKSYKSIREQLLAALPRDPDAEALFDMYRYSSRGPRLEARFEVHGGCTPEETAQRLDKKFGLNLQREPETGHLTFRLDDLTRRVGKELVATMIQYKTAAERQHQRMWNTMLEKYPIYQNDPKPPNHSA